MKKILSVCLAVSMLFGLVSLTGSAAAGRSITLPFVYMTDEAGNQTLRYTAAVVCNGDHLPEPVDPDIADGKLPEKPACTEHATVIYCKHGDNAENPDIDYTISYDMEKYGAPDETGEITGITEGFFEFTVTMAEKYVQQVTITANGGVITPNSVTGRYVLPMTYSYLLEIPTPDEEAGYYNFALRVTRVNFPATNTKEGYNLYTYNFGTTDDSDRGNLYERQNGRYGQDYYVKLLVQDGYRNCLKTLDTDVPDFSDDDYVLPVKLYASQVPNSPLPPLDSADQVHHVANIYVKRLNGLTTYAYDFFDDPTDDVAEAEGSYTLCGRVYKIDGEVMKAESVDLVVQGVVADQVNSVFSWFFRIIRMIVNLLKNFNIL